MSNAKVRRISPKKLLLTKWTAVNPAGKEKHFIVVGLIEPEAPGSPVELVQLEAIHSHRVLVLPWRALNDGDRWLQGWC